MKNSIFLLANLFMLLCFNTSSFAGDIYAEYTITGMGKTPVINKMYSKNGDLRTEVNMNIGGRSMKTTTLMLKSNPNTILIFNSMTKTYTETKTTGNASIKNFDVKVIGNEKVGNYNCTHVRMSAEGKSWDMWLTKDLPSLNFQVTGNDVGSNKKTMDLLKTKGITGMAVKISFLDPKTNKPTINMMLTKFEQKNLNASLFTIPAGYKKNSMSMDPEKMKNMTPQQKKEMMMKMMKEQMKN